MIAEDEARRAFGGARKFHPCLAFAGDCLEFGDGATLARVTRANGEIDLVFEGGLDRAVARLSAPYLRPVSRSTIAKLRRAAQEWALGDKALAQIRIAQSGLPGFQSGEEIAHRLSLVDYLLEQGSDPGALVKSLHLESDLPLGKTGYNPSEPRIPKGEDGGGEWAKWFVHAFALVAQIWRYNVDPSRQKDEVETRNIRGRTVYDPYSPTRTLLAPKRADYGAILKHGEQYANKSTAEKLAALADRFFFGATYDFQRNADTMTFYAEYEDASNYAIGVFARGAGLSKEDISSLHQFAASYYSSNAGSPQPLDMVCRGWDDANAEEWGSVK